MPLTLDDINQIYRGIKIERQNIDDLEALLIHGDDITALRKEVYDNRLINTMSSGFNSSNELIIMGIKIIESYHIQPGSVFKVWKPDQKRDKK